MFKAVAKETRAEILGKVKEGKYSVPELAKQYGVSDKTIYNWLRQVSTPEVNLVEYNRMKRENDELKRIIGIITLDLERGKKNRDSKYSK